MKKITNAKEYADTIFWLNRAKEGEHIVRSHSDIESIFNDGRKSVMEDLNMEWIDLGNDTHIMHTPFFGYYVEKEVETNYFKIKVKKYLLNGEKYDTLDEAKQVAERDYRRRLRKALKL